MMHFMNGQLTSLLIDDDPKSTNNETGMFALEMELPTLLQMKNSRADPACVSLFRRSVKA
jgi:hypothetical protein